MSTKSEPAASSQIASASDPALEEIADHLVTIAEQKAYISDTLDDILAYEDGSLLEETLS